MVPEIVEKSGFLVVGVRYSGSLQHEEVEWMWRERLLPRLPELPGDDKQKSVFIGVRLSLTAGDDGGFEYIAGISTRNLDGVPDGMAGWYVSGGKFAVVDVATVSDIDNAYRYLYESWMPQQVKIRRRNAPCFEVFPFGVESADARILVHVPIAIKGETSVWERWLG